MIPKLKIDFGQREVQVLRRPLEIDNVGIVNRKFEKAQAIEPLQT
jgi:hypothetical protein